MAAYCDCCGAEITDPAETCPVCGMPRHGMIPAGCPVSLADEPDSLCNPEPPLALDTRPLASTVPPAPGKTALD